MENLNWSGFYKHIDFNIDYDFYEPYIVKQYDTRSRGLYVQIVQNGLVITPSASNSLTFFAVKPDGEEIFAPGVIENGLFRVDFPNQALTVAGQMKGELALRGANNEVITKSITVTIEPSLELTGVESTNEFTALQQALAQVTGFAGEIQDVQLFAEAIKANLGELEDLDTEVKTSIVNSINELNSKISNVLNSSELETLLSAKVDLVTLGDMSLLETDEKEVLVNVINELFNDIEEIRNVSDVSTLLPLLNSKADKTTVGNLVDLVDFEDPNADVNNLVQAINYVFTTMKQSFENLGDINLEGLALSEDLGDKTTLTTDDKTNLVNAINEINAALKTVESVTDVEQLSLLLSGKADKSSLGSLSELTTTQKNNLVAAINELKVALDASGDVDLSDIYTSLDTKLDEVIFQTFMDAILTDLNCKVDKTIYDAEILTLQQNIDTIELTPGPPGQPGEPGQPGADGLDGADGKSAYQIWLNAGNTGTEQDFLDSLEGPQGPPGEGSGEGGSLSMIEDEVTINNQTTQYGAQVNVSERSSVVASNRWQINVGTESEPQWISGQMLDDYSLDPNFEQKFVTPDGKIYAEVMLLHSGEWLIMIERIERGERRGLTAYPARKIDVPSHSQVNASDGATTSGKFSQVNASDSSEVSGTYSQINASESSTASGVSSQVNASQSSTASGVSSQVNASEGSTASGRRSQVNASEGSVANALSQVNASSKSEARGNNGGWAQVNSSNNSTAEGYNVQINASIHSKINLIDYVNHTQINASCGIVNDTSYSSAWGWGPWYEDPSTSNIKIHLLSKSGNINHSGVLNSGHNFTDYAELFPNLTGVEQGYGLIQTIDGHGVRPANSGDQVVGVTSATAGVVLGETPFSWADRWLKDEWGAYIYHDVPNPDWEPNEDEGQTEEDRPTITVPKENTEYDPEREYAKRQDRPDEWTVVGLVGQVYVRLDENVQPMDYVKPLNNGVGQTSLEPTNIRVMKITQEFDENKGYKIGFCLLK